MHWTMMAACVCCIDKIPGLLKFPYMIAFLIYYDVLIDDVISYDYENVSTPRDSLLVAGYSDPALLDIFGEIPKQNVSSLPTGHGVNNNTLFYWSDLNAPIMDKKSANISEVLDTLLRSYDLSLRPNVDGSPTEVSILAMIVSNGPISESDMTFQIDLYFAQIWQDERLRYNGPLPDIPLDMKVLDNIWKPDTHFYNGIDAYNHDVPRPNKRIMLHYAGHVMYTMKITVKLRCPMQLYNFPMDEQNCPFVIGSYSHNASEIVYKWKSEKPIQLLPSMTHSQFSMAGYELKELNMKKRFGNFSVLQLNFHFARKAGYYYIQVYLPCSLIVILSWISFWIHREATGDRIGLGITTVLTLSTFVMETRDAFPEVHYATALDLFIFVCFAFVIAAMLEFTGVHYFTKVGSGEWSEQHYNGGDSEDDGEWETIEAQHLVGQDTPMKIDDGPGPNQNTAHEVVFDLSYPSMSSNLVNGAVTKQSQASFSRPVHWDETHDRPSSSGLVKFLCCLLGNEEFRAHLGRGAKGPNSISKIDKVSRVLFPFAFLAFNVIYWSIYYFDHNGVKDWEDTD